MEILPLLLSVLANGVWGYAPLREPGPGGAYNDASFIQDLMERINRDMEPDAAYLDIGNKMDHQGMGFGGILPGKKDSEFFDENDYDFPLGPGGHNTISRDPEFLHHSTLFGQNKVSPSGSLKVKGQKVPTEPKSDAVLPAYCNPPNPCPVGYSAEDGCLEIFENTASFSRAYQGSQDCMCDTEHMFDCHASQEAEDDEESQFLSDLQQVDGEHKSLVAKKFYNKKAPEQTLSRLNEMARTAAANAVGMKQNENPYLQGEKLPIAAKKGHHAL